ncbi:hypothetical protein Fmac_007341 [Flemingia macrophylla]|uniref:Uncharacterized protein n=1 Tax=Flemingia macrophylla TaxID=520843 RepID=A0ABD1MUA3_9FABA
MTNITIAFDGIILLSTKPNLRAEEQSMGSIPIILQMLIFFLHTNTKNFLPK